ncbi:MAG: polysaccharide biosynthesis/export family protein [Verrucomicrobiales bacterium]
MKLQLGRLLLWGVMVIALGTGCRSSKTGPKFDAHAESKKILASATNITILTNLSSVETTNRLGPELLQPSTNLFTLGPGDKIEVEILGDNSSRTITSIGPDGKIYFNLLPGLDVWGLTLSQTKELLERELKQFITAPQVSVQLRAIDSKRIWVLGRVQNAGVYPIGGSMNILEALSIAGGPMTSSASGTTEELADLSHSFIIRNGQMLPIDFNRLLQQGDMSQNIYLQPDDFIYLPSSLSRDIYVLGAVRTPKAVARQHSSLVAAVADSGGPVKDAHLTHVAIVRGSLADPKIAIVNYNDIIKGRAPDVLLEPRDIVYVPLAPYRHLAKYADLIVTTFVRAVAINEGARAAVEGAAPAGVNIGIISTP